MRAVLQKVAYAKVDVDGKTVGSIGKGIAALVGFKADDDEKTMDYMIDKIFNLRIFEDENGKMNLSVKDVSGRALVVSNFTLHANYAHGNRPDYLNSAAPAIAKELYEFFISEMKARIGKCESGVFGADMRTEMSTDGPVTIVMDSKILLRK